MIESPGFELVRRGPPEQLEGIVHGMSGYLERGTAAVPLREAASLTVPIVLGFGTPFRIARERAPELRDGRDSFVAGAGAGPVQVRSDGGAACLQVDLTPIGAFRLFGEAMPALAGRLVPIEVLLGADGPRLVERLKHTPSWDARFTLATQFLTRRARHAPTPEVVHAYGRLAASSGDLAVGVLAREIGWSRTRLAARFRAEIGLGPKVVARLMRFARARLLAAEPGSTGWADVAFACGYADQAHLVREFRVFAGEPPTGWAKRMATTDPRLVHPARGNGSPIRSSRVRPRHRA